ncbi:CinA family protein [Glaciecola sp. KUL10]|uniref:CinA family protein n=1 Tax=Glaciecola sp. (strain KUL10) TaxID=2161813 RepID=UPI000D8DD118|nr:nicotinamide-nucleotide amidohydrolase family protein [Glaciecola sp. KUL10]GBL04212.1 CinA-related protein [Glaciecola sp. KUL10]
MSRLFNKSIEALSAHLGDVLLQQEKYVTTAESCSGGGIACAITDTAGSSAWFEKAWITYSNQAKADEVGVSDSVLQKHGAVSEEVVIQMATGALSKSGADISVAVSGIAGPGGGTDTKPVGLVWFAIADNHGTISFSRCFSGNRKQVREQTIKLALQELIARLVA